MKNVLITGGDGSLGRTLMDYAENLGYMPYSIHSDHLSVTGISYCLGGTYAPIQFDYVINNFGVNKLHRLGDPVNYPNIMHILQMNVAVPYMIVHEFAKHRKPCRILNIASQTYRVPQRYTGGYCASKAALVQLTKVMARELAGYGWVINALAPGKIIDTKMSEETDRQVREMRGWSQDEADKYALNLIPMHRFTTRDEVSEAAFKILDLPEYINGTVIDMMGGV